jgi:hypothetical protein
MNREKLQRIDDGSPMVSEFLRRLSCTTEAKDPRPASLHNLHRVHFDARLGAQPWYFTSIIVL